MKLRNLAATAAACLTLGLAASHAQADPIVEDQWYNFDFGGDGSALLSGPGNVDVSIAAPNPPWTITLATAMVLIVTDGFLQGDEFELFDFGASIGSTSVSADDSSHSCGDNVVACLADPLMSHGTFLLAAGNHSLTGIVTDSPFELGSAFFIIQQVPEPGTVALLGIALASLALGRRKRAA